LIVLSTKMSREERLRQRRKERLSQTASQREESITGIKRPSPPTSNGEEQNPNVGPNADSQPSPDAPFQDLMKSFSLMQGLMGQTRPREEKKKWVRFSASWWVHEVLKKLFFIAIICGICFCSYKFSRPDAKYGIVLTTDSGSFWWTRRVAFVRYNNGEPDFNITAGDHIVGTSDVTNYPLRHKVMPKVNEDGGFNYVPIWAELCVPPVERDNNFVLAKIFFSVPIFFSLSFFFMFIRSMWKLIKVD